MSRGIVKKYDDLERDCNLVSMFYYTFSSGISQKPTKKEIEVFIKIFQQSEKEEAKERMLLIKDACKRCN